MGALLVPVVLIILVVIVGAILAVRFSRRETALEDSMKNQDIPALRYHVPEGQDGAAIIAALRNEGYEAAADHGTGDQDVLVPCPGGTETQRGRVRAVIQHAALNMEGDQAAQPRVRFADE